MNRLFFMGLADEVKCLSNCRGSRFGAVITDGSSVFIGYSGNQFDKTLCECERCEKRQKGEIKSGEDLDLCKCQHAEMTALRSYEKHCLNFDHKFDLYIQSLPCNECAVIIYLARKYIDSVNIYDDYYAKDDLRTKNIKELLESAGIKINYINASDVANFKWKCHYR